MPSPFPLYRPACLHSIFCHKSVLARNIPRCTRQKRGYDGRSQTFSSRPRGATRVNAVLFASCPPGYYSPAPSRSSRVRQKMVDVRRSLMLWARLRPRLDNHHRRFVNPLLRHCPHKYILPPHPSTFATGSPSKRSSIRGLGAQILGSFDVHPRLSLHPNSAANTLMRCYLSCKSFVGGLMAFCSDKRQSIAV
ncbi:hypothetical protein C8J56DRAFT_250347 [Mycena floridula]|nr:hypothetical protein C8J56DRAFT_250347 [Mycena floridula]